MLPAADTPPETSTLASVWRRAEVIIEREVVTVHYSGTNAVVGECPQCGREVLMRDERMSSSGLAVDPLKKPNP